MRDHIQGHISVTRFRGLALRTFTRVPTELMSVSFNGVSHRGCRYNALKNRAFAGFINTH